MSPGFWMLFGFAALAASIAAGCRWPRLWLGLTVFGAAAGLVAAVAVLAGGVEWEWRGGFVLGGEAPHLRLDGLSAWFLALLSLGGGAGAVYSREYWPDREHPVSAPRGRMWWSVMVAGMGLVLIVSNGLHFLMVWEVFSISSYFAITLDRQRPEVREAGRVYLVASQAGTLCLFAFFALMAARLGSWDLGPVAGRQELRPLFWLALVGFGLKAGFFPLHIWLPGAHASAPSHVSAIMSGVAIKMGVYGLFRFSGWLPVPASAGWVVLALGASSAVAGMAFGMVQNDLKRLLAYCSVENVGVILTGLGCALLATGHGGAAWGRLALAGALLHVWNHGAFKSLLFYGAGSVLHATGTREMSRLGGLWRVMPWTAGLFALGAVAASSLPPLNGFVSEWLIYLGLFESVSSRGGAAWMAIPAAILLAMAGAMTLMAFTKASSVVFLGAARTRQAKAAHECGPLMRWTMVLWAMVCGVIGLAPVFLWPALSRGVASWRPAWVSTEPAPAPLAGLGLAQLGLAVLAGAAVLALWRKTRANGVSRAVTWDCGYAAPTPRMQYTSGSFSGIPEGWFAWLLRPEVRLRRPSVPWPAKASRSERAPETVLERLVAPSVGLVLRLALAARGLQHGRVQAYILYVVSGLIWLGILVWAGGAR